MYSKEKQSWVKHFDFMLLDILALVLAYVLAYFIRNGIAHTDIPSRFQTLVVALIVVDVVVAFFLESYKDIVKRGYFSEFKNTLLHVSVTCVGVLIFLFLTKTIGQYSRFVLTVAWLLGIIICYCVRVRRKENLRKKINSGTVNCRSMIVFTTSDLASEIINRFRRNEYGDKKITGVVILNEDRTGQKIEGIEVVASVDHAIEYICRNWVDEILVDEKYLKNEKVNEILNSCMEMGITTHVTIMECESMHNKIVESIGGYTVVSSSINVVSMKQMVAKRTMDICGGIVGCLITIFLFVCVAPIIYIKSPGPIFFSQQRVGRNGKVFKIYKFRSMYMDAEERKQELMKQNKIKDGMMFKMDNDPRIIKGIGHFIRKTSIDEFPQFFNVLKGDMSLVGTRPPTLDEWGKYSVKHRARMAIKPGLTGMWQVSGRSNITDFDEVVALDKKYIAEWNLKNDIKILCKTVKVILTGSGSQ